jgi:hypothetical protein
MQQLITGLDLPQVMRYRHNMHVCAYSTYVGADMKSGDVHVGSIVCSASQPRTSLNCLPINEYT